MIERISFYRADLGELERTLLENVLESRILTTGPYIFRFQDEVKRTLKVDYFLATSTGTSALHIAIRVMNLGKDDEVIISPFVHIGVANTLINEGVSMLLADVNEETLNIDPISVRDLIDRFYIHREGKLINRFSGKVLRGIVLYHLYGTPCDMESFMKLKNEFNLSIIEICWESFGNKFKLGGEFYATGTYFDVGVFSFTRYGPLNVGEGGGVVFKNSSDYEKGEKIRYHGVDAEYVEYQAIFGGFNYNLDEMSCAIGLGQMMRLNEILDKRERVFRTYKRFLSELKEITIISKLEYKSIIPYSLTVLLPENVDRKRVVSLMHASGVPTKVFYPPLNQIEFYKGIFMKENLSILRVVNKFAPRIISLPFYGDLSQSDIEYIVEVFKKVLRGLG
ncbi:MAG: DegT/DnrJ/EryC1/StrS aminotransferase family protein [candidate division WOR-3 bacterium]